MYILGQKSTPWKFLLPLLEVVVPLWLMQKFRFAIHIFSGNIFPHFIHKFFVLLHVLGVKIRNLKVDFKTGGTWCRVAQ